jgi:acetyltransferase-like isoleucine patch superfamily enzyme
MITCNHGLRGNLTFSSQIIMKTDSTKIDATDDITIYKNVIISDDVYIYTHDHDMNSDDRNGNIVHSPLVIEENVFIGVRATILNSCNRIGKNSVIGACTVVTKDVPDNVVYAGNPGKIIRKLK